MARIPYPDIGGEAMKPLVDSIVGERGSVLHLYRLLLHSPPVAQGWLALLTAIRQQCTLPAELRELAILRIATLNGATYEADQHRSIALASGLSEQQIDALASDDPAAHFDARQNAVVELADAMTRQVQVPESTLAEVAKIFDHRTLVELVATIAAYNMVSRFLVALDVQSSDAVEGP